MSPRGQVGKPEGADGLYAVINDPPNHKQTQSLYPWLENPVCLRCFFALIRFPIFIKRSRMVLLPGFNKEDEISGPRCIKLWAYLKNRAGVRHASTRTKLIER